MNGGQFSIMKVGGMMKKIISILLALCLSGCTVLDSIDTYNNEYNYNYKNKETYTTEENQNQTKNGFTVFWIILFQNHLVF